MTKQELIKMVGNEDRAEYALNILLKNLKPQFIKMCVENELKEVESKIKEYQEKGYIWLNNGTYAVNWCKPDKQFESRGEGWGWTLTEEEQAFLDKEREECGKADYLIKTRNMLNTILYHN